MALNDEHMGFALTQNPISVLREMDLWRVLSGEEGL